MKTLKKISPLIFSTFLLCSISNSYAEGLNHFTITFKEGTDEKYIKLINLFTNTEIKNKLANNKYTFTTSKNPDSSTINNYSYLFSMIPEVENIKPEINISLKNKKAGDYVDGVILVKYKEGTSSQEIAKIDSSYKTRSVLFSKALNLYQVKLPVNLNVDQAVKIFSKLSQVKYAEPDRVMTIQKNNNRLHISFKNNETLAQKIFENIYDIKTSKITNSSYYLINISDKYDLNQVIKSFKLSPYIMDIKQVK